MRQHWVFGVLVFAAAIALAVSPASSEQAQFSIEGGSGARVITLDTKVHDGAVYVPLQGLVEQAGGAYNVLSTRVRVDLDSTTAWLRIGEARVHALSIFSLKQPITDEGGAAMIAAEDVPDFFLKSFRITARRGAAPVSTPPASTTPNTTVTPSAGASPSGPPAPRPAESAPMETVAAPTPVVAAISAIFIDAGHGGYDAGVQSADKLGEAAIVLGVAKRVKTMLEAGGRTNVILSRPDEKEVPLAQRAKLVRLEPGSIFISLHLGSSLSATAQGIAAFYPAAPPAASARAAAATAPVRPDARLSVESRRLAEGLAQSVAQSANAPLRGVLEVPLKALSEFQVPSVEIELGCLTSSAEAQRLGSDEYLGQLASGIVKGIQAYLDNSTAAAAAPSTTPSPAVPAGAAKEN